MRGAGPDEIGVRRSTSPWLWFLVVGILGALAAVWLSSQGWPGTSQAAIVAPSSQSGWVDVVCQKDPGGAGYAFSVRSGGSVTCNNGAVPHMTPRD